MASGTGVSIFPYIFETWPYKQIEHEQTAVTVDDGSGKSQFKADVGINADTITLIDDLSKAKREMMQNEGFDHVTSDQPHALSLGINRVMANGVDVYVEENSAHAFAGSRTIRRAN